jgi:hypothetical protein
MRVPARDRQTELILIAQWNQHKPGPSGWWALWYRDFSARTRRFFVRHGNFAAPADWQSLWLDDDTDTSFATSADQRPLRPDDRNSKTAARRWLVWDSSCPAAAAAAAAATTTNRRRALREHFVAASTDRGPFRRSDTVTAGANGGTIWWPDSTAAAATTTAVSSYGRALRWPEFNHRRHVRR